MHLVADKYRYITGSDTILTVIRESVRFELITKDRWRLRRKDVNNSKPHYGQQYSSNHSYSLSRLKFEANFKKLVLTWKWIIWQSMPRFYAPQEKSSIMKYSSGMSARLIKAGHYLAVSNQHWQWVKNKVHRVYRNYVIPSEASAVEILDTVKQTFSALCSWLLRYNESHSRHVESAMYARDQRSFFRSLNKSQRNIQTVNFLLTESKAFCGGLPA